MADLALPLGVVVAYVAVLVAVAVWAERQEGRGRRVASNALVYSLSLTVYASTWTFYGSVGFAARTGVLFLTVYLGPTLCAVVWWWLLRRLILLRDRHRLTTLADLLSLRYAKSHRVALLATVVVCVGLVPYLALQLKTMIATLGIAAGGGPGLAYPGSGRRLGPPIVALMLVFTIAFGLRRVRPTERHPGMVLALAIESVVKLAAFLAAGAAVTWGLFDGPADVLRRAVAAGSAAPAALGNQGAVSWLAHLLLSGVAVLLLPRQFHVAVVESSDARHVRTAMWLFPLYLLAINLFVLPVALGGLLLGFPAARADTFVLDLPLASGHPLVSWLVFLGGFSAGIGMLVVETTALATMISNHVVIPAAARWSWLRPLRRQLLATRWVAAAGVLAAAFAYERHFGRDYSLASIGFISFAAVLQLAPALFGGLVWRGASRAGAVAGLAAGFLTWGYTLVVPVLARAGWLPASLLVDGPFGIETLVPEGLFDLHLDPVSHAVIWTLVANGGAFVLFSLLLPAGKEEAARVERLLGPIEPPAPAAAVPAPPLADVAGKRARAAALFAEYHGAETGEALADECLARVGARPGGALTAVQLAELQSEVETTLAAAIGSAAAHAAIRRDPLVTPEESRAVASAYADILASLNLSPAELQRKIDYHLARERILTRDAERQRFLAAVSGRLAASLELESTAEVGVRLAIPQLADAALLWLAPAEGQPARTWFAHADAAAERAGCEALACAAEALGGPSGRARPGAGRASSLRPVDAAAWPAALRPALPRGVELTLPLRAGRDVVGTLSLFADDPARLHAADDVPVAEELARRLAIALENARLYRRAAEAVRVRDEFLAVASHELKTPLTPLRLKIQTLERLVARGELGQVPRETLVRIFGGAEGQLLRLVGLVDDLLDVTRLTTKKLTLRPEPMDLAAAAQEVLERHAGDATQAGCTVRLDAPGPVTGAWDRMRIEQVVTNLLVNALKYAPGSCVEVAIAEDGPRAVLVVRDRGPGIPLADQERIFRPFERAVGYAEVSGFGLGLFIVRQIVDAHGGRIGVESAPGRGTVFRVELPREAAGAGVNDG